jgi:hypothetical protein
MNKKAVITYTVLCIALTANAVLPVTDYGLTIQSEINHIQSFAKQVLQYEQELQIQINTLNTYEQEVLQVVAMGNPMTYISPIVGDVQQVVGGLATTERTLVGQYQQLESLASPQTYLNTLNSVMGQFQLPQWTGNVSTLGVVTTPFGPNFQFQASQYTVAVQTQRLIQSIEVQKNGIEALIKTLTSEVSTGATTSQVQKLHASISALQVTLASLNNRETQLRAQAAMFNQQVGAAQALYKTASAEQMAATFQQAQENGISATGGVIQGNATEFGAVDDPNPATNPLGINGGGDPGLTSGNWYTGASGANIGSTNSTGVSLPAATEIAQFGSTAAAQGQMVTVTDPSTGTSVSAPIVDIGPGAAAVAKGAVVDLTYGTARQLGMAVNGSMPVQVSFPTKVN